MENRRNGKKNLLGTGCENGRLMNVAQDYAQGCIGGVGINISNIEIQS
jgi:hypothetical protein